MDAAVGTGTMRMPFTQIAPSVGLFQVETCSRLVVTVKTPKLCHVTPWSFTPTGASSSFTANVLNPLQAVVHVEAGIWK